MSHIKTAHEYGVKQALKEEGYASLEEVQKIAEDLGLVEKPSSNSLEGLLAAVSKR